MNLKPCKCGGTVELRHHADHLEHEHDGCNQWNPCHEYDYIICLKCGQQWTYVSYLHELPNPEDLADRISARFAEYLVLGADAYRKQKKENIPVVKAWNSGDDYHLSSPHVTLNNKGAGKYD